MLRFNRVLCVILVCAGVGAAYAAVVKIKDLHPAGIGLIQNPNADGMAILHYKQQSGFTDVNVVITDFLPNTVYGVCLSPGGQVSGTIETNESGNGHIHDDTFAGDITAGGCVTVTIFVGTLFEGDCDQMTPDQVRAVGSNCP